MVISCRTFPGGFCCSLCWLSKCGYRCGYGRNEISLGNGFGLNYEFGEDSFFLIIEGH